MKNIKKQNGITLLTLVVTITILIILAVIATSEMQRDGILGHADNLKGDFDELQSQYNQLINGLENELTNDFTHDDNEEYVECTEHVLNDGVITKAATCYSTGEKVYACTNAGCTYIKTEVIPTLAHDYNYKNTSDTYLKTNATCTTPAVYYYSCSKCGVKWTTTFENGTALGHSFTVHDTSATYLKTAATCTSQAIYYCSCSRCGEKGENTFGSGNALGHSFTVEDTSATYLKTAATCTSQAVYYYSCVRCGQASTNKTFSSGELLVHTSEEYNLYYKYGQYETLENGSGKFYISETSHRKERYYKCCGEQLSGDIIEECEDPDGDGYCICNQAIDRERVYTD